MRPHSLSSTGNKCLQALTLWNSVRTSTVSGSSCHHRHTLSAQSDSNPMKSKAIHPLEHKRDAYGFAVRPQHVQRYREYANIYKMEEEERSDRWNIFLEQLIDPDQAPISRVTSDEVDIKNDNKIPLQDDITPEKADNHQEATDKDKLNAEKYDPGEEIPEKMLQTEPVQEKKVHRIQIWSNIRPSLHVIEDMMSTRVKKMGNVSCNGHGADAEKPLQPGEEVRFVKGASEEDSEEEFYDVERSDSVQDVPLGENASLLSTGGTNKSNNIPPSECTSPWKEELEVLVRGGVPMALRGELWQAFVGVKTRRQEKYYRDLLSSESHSGYSMQQEAISSNEQNKEGFAFHEKYKGQIEKDLPRTFPGHPALDEDGRNALRRLLIAYARHNPSVGYCQAMNFFAGLLLLLMPEENAFWALLGILDDYFDGYYSEDMIECQVDQLVFEDLVREGFPKLVNHLDYLGVQIAWVTGPWFLSIFMNMLPWESVLRVWDVLLFEGGRVMLFRTALALMELYGPALVTTRDAGDAVTLLQSLAGSTFDSSQLVLTACMGFQNVNEARLKELRDKYRPAVMIAIEERSKGLYALKNSKGLASKLYTFKNNAVSSIIQPHKSKIADEQSNGDTTHLESGSTTPDEYAVSLAGDVDVDPGLDLQEQVIWLKVELCKLLEEKSSAELRAEELESALMEMVKQDNRRQLSARVEQLEQEASDLRCLFSDKQEQERAMLQVLMRVEQEQKVTEDARRYAEQDAVAQRHTSQILQDKYEEALASLAEMEKRAIMAESMLEATLQYQSGQVQAQASPRSVQSDSPGGQSNNELASEIPARKVSLLSRSFGLGWRARNKEKPNNTEELSDSKSPTEEALSPAVQQKETALAHKEHEQQQQQPTEG